MPPYQYEIRIAQLEDAAALSEIGARTFIDSFSEHNTPEDMTAYITSSFSLEQITKELNNPRNRFLLASKEKEVIGYAKLAENRPPDSVRGGNPLELARIYVDRPFIGKGVGAALMQAAITYATRVGRDMLWLGVWQKNPRAIEFYTRWGFQQVGEQTFQLGSDLQDDFVLALPLC